MMVDRHTPHHTDRPAQMLLKHEDMRVSVAHIHANPHRRENVYDGMMLLCFVNANLC